MICAAKGRQSGLVRKACSYVRYILYSGKYALRAVVKRAKLTLFLSYACVCNTGPFQSTPLALLTRFNVVGSGLVEALQAASHSLTRLWQTGPVCSQVFGRMIFGSCFALRVLLWWWKLLPFSAWEDLIQSRLKDTDVIVNHCLLLCRAVIAHQAD